MNQEMENGEKEHQTGEYSVNIKDLAEEERPLEKMLGYGPSFLSEKELLALVLHSGTPKKNALELAGDMLMSSGGLKNLSNLECGEFSCYEGVGEMKAARLRSVFELARRMSVSDYLQKPKISGPEDAAGLIMSEMSFMDREVFKVIILDTKNRVIAVREVSRGTLNSSPAHPREIFKPAVMANASSVILAHNHPSGDPAPSREDIKVTERIVGAGKILGIEVLDHVVIGDNKFISLKEKGLM